MKKKMNYVGWFFIIAGITSSVVLIMNLPQDVGVFEMWFCLSLLSMCIGGLIKIIRLDIDNN